MVNRVLSQDVSASYASIGIVRLTFTAARQDVAAPTAPTDTVPSGVDSVSLSPQALTAAQDSDASAVTTNPAPSPPASDDAGTAVPASTSKATSRVDGLAAALIQVLDTNHDNSLSQEEFVEGAKALLGRGRVRRRGVDEDNRAAAVAQHERGHHVGGGHRLERRLEKAFGRIDADDSGSLDAGELATALARAARRKPEPAAPVDRIRWHQWRKPFPRR